MIKENYPDIKALCDKVEPKDQKFKFTMYAESTEAAHKIIDSDVINLTYLDLYYLLTLNNNIRDWLLRWSSISTS